MSDLALRWDPNEGSADLVVDANDLLREEGLETAVLISLFTDRRADAADQLPSGDTDRRGWWADAVPVVEGDQIGSRLWLLARERDSGRVRARAEEYAREALQWLVDDLVAERVEVTADVPRVGWLALEVVIYRPQQDPARYRFNSVWAAQEG
jgi:phage gp46-like protein